MAFGSNKEEVLPSKCQKKFLSEQCPSDDCRLGCRIREPVLQGVAMAPCWQHDRSLSNLTTAGRRIGNGCRPVLLLFSPSFLLLFRLHSSSTSHRPLSLSTCATLNHILPPISLFPLKSPPIFIIYFTFSIFCPLFFATNHLFSSLLTQFLFTQTLTSNFPPQKSGHLKVFFGHAIVGLYLPTLQASICKPFCTFNSLLDLYKFHHH